MAIKPTMKPSKLLPESPKKTLKPFIKLKLKTRNINNGKDIIIKYSVISCFRNIKAKKEYEIIITIEIKEVNPSIQSL